MVPGRPTKDLAYPEQEKLKRTWAVGDRNQNTASSDKDTLKSCSLIICVGKIHLYFDKHMIHCKISNQVV